LKYSDKKGKQRKGFIKVDHDIKNVHPEAVWQGVINPDMTWAYAKESSFKMALRAVYKDPGMALSMAKKVREDFLASSGDLYEKFANLIYKRDSKFAEWLESIKAEECL
jgi:hypothetical protein